MLLSQRWKTEPTNKGYRELLGLFTLGDIFRFFQFCKQPMTRAWWNRERRKWNEAGNRENTFICSVNYHLPQRLFRATAPASSYCTRNGCRGKSGRKLLPRPLLAPWTSSGLPVFHYAAHGLSGSSLILPRQPLD